MKKKILFCLFTFCISLMLIGCGEAKTTPTARVEEFMKKYQDMDSDVLTQLDQIISEDTTLSDDQKEDYRALMEKQYQNLSYKVKNESIASNTATVDVEVEVYDFSTTNAAAEKYRTEHADEFAETEDKTSDELYTDYRIKELKDVTERKKETITFNLTKDDKDEWEVSNLSDDDISKLHGLYDR